MEKIVVGIAGAGRGAELHCGGYTKVYGVDLRLKKILGRRPEQVERAKEDFHVEQAVYSFDELLDDPEINLIDIVTPPYAHPEMIVKALEAGKNVICEKPLTGCFDTTLTKKQMFERLQESLSQLEDTLKRSGKHFMYAENFVYAPTIQRAAELLQARKSRILFLKGEESLKGSSSPVAGQWSKTGGGTLMRVGSHPLGAALYLKQVEAAARGVRIDLDSVICDCASVTPTLNEYEHRAIAARPVDVEDMCTMVMAFSDGSRATIIANDTLLGGSRNYIELYCNDAVINCNLTLTNNMQTYLPDADGLEDFTLSEMLPVKTGWNHPFVMDDVMRGFAGEMQDFCEAVAFDRKAKSDFRLAYDTTLAMYAAYYSAESGKRVFLKKEG